MKQFNKLEQQLLNDYQSDFPVCSQPFTKIAEQLHSSESDILSTFKKFHEQRIISRIGAIVNHTVIGASTLAAMAIPENRIDDVAEFISNLPEVNHNYAREHKFNLWFVLTAASEEQIQSTLQYIQSHWPSYPLLDLPMETAYHIDLGFSLWA